MKHSDITRERQHKIKRGIRSDTAIIKGAKKAVNAIKSAPNKIGEAASKLAEKGAKKVMKSKWWNS